MRKTVCAAAVGFLAAAGFAAFVLSTLMTISTGIFDLKVLLMGPIALFPFALVAVLVFGSPALLALSPLAPGRWWMPLVAGSVLGVPLLHILPGEPAFETALVFIPLSSLSALVFWLVWRWLSEREGTCCAC